MKRTVRAAKATFKKMQRKAHAAKQHNQTATKSPRRKIFRKPLRMRSVAEHLRRASQVLRNNRVFAYAITIHFAQNFLVRRGAKNFSDKELI